LLLASRRPAWDTGAIRRSSAVGCWICWRRVARSPTSHRDLGVSEQTVYNWRCQDRIDRGLEPGAVSTELSELTAAKKRMRELARPSR
jgi:hypothetical protein